ncbi:hypothetical protein Zmor_028453 [Zophobas morio]|uniref:Uncharacterized protein n=1 Tax=Zophobas morio TaxID=2755281 RepID=A0AA38HQ32_9CUCU|nr:hypothetical protein Zmor_028453 [Zophobas morio]
MPRYTRNLYPTYDTSWSLAEYLEEFDRYDFPSFGRKEPNEERQPRAPTRELGPPNQPAPRRGGHSPARTQRQRVQPRSQKHDWEDELRELVGTSTKRSRRGRRQKNRDHAVQHHNRDDVYDVTLVPTGGGTIPNTSSGAQQPLQQQFGGDDVHYLKPVDPAPTPTHTVMPQASSQLPAGPPGVRDQVTTPTHVTETITRSALPKSRNTPSKPPVHTVPHRACGQVVTPSHTKEPLRPTPTTSESPWPISRPAGLPHLSTRSPYSA